MDLLRALLARLPEGLREFLLYGLASALALALDWGLLFALTTFGMNYLAAAAIGFTSGIAITYALSVKVVFRYRRLADRRRELAAFLAVGVAGLALTQALLAIWVEWIGLAPVLAKAPTAVMVFLFNFGVRRALLFRAPRQAA